MVTGNFWNVDNPLKPWGYFDPQSVLDMSIYWADWLTALGTTHAGHVVTATAPLEIVQTTFVDGDVIFRVRVVDSELVVIGAKLAVTCHIVAADGQEDDQTVWLKLWEK